MAFNGLRQCTSAIARHGHSMLQQAAKQNKKSKKNSFACHEAIKSQQPHATYCSFQLLSCEANAAYLLLDRIEKAASHKLQTFFIFGSEVVRKSSSTEPDSFKEL